MSNSLICDFLCLYGDYEYRFRDRTGFLSEPSYLVVKVACMNIMFLTPTFVRETAGTAFLDQAELLFIGTSWISLCHKYSTPVLVFGVELA